MNRLLYFTLCAMAAGVPFLRESSSNATTATRFPEWPTELHGKPIAEIPLDPADARFAAGFPGKIGKFTDGEKEYILRWIGSPTRKLHSSADCLRGAGFTVTGGQVWREATGEHWNSFRAERSQKRYRVRERIADQTGGEWTDISAWYWSAVLNRTHAPWFAVTVVERESTSPLMAEHQR